MARASFTAIFVPSANYMPMAAPGHSCITTVSLSDKFTSHNQSSLSHSVAGMSRGARISAWVSKDSGSEES